MILFHRQQQQSTATSALLLLMSISLNGCGLFFRTIAVDPDSESNYATVDVTGQDEDGVLTAMVTPSSDSAIRLTANTEGSIAGSSVTFPPGSLSVETEVTVQEGQSLVATEISEALGVESTALTQAGPAVVIQSAAAVDAVEPFSFAISLSDGASLNDAGSYAVLYKVIRYDQGGQFFVGIIPTNQVKVVDNTLVFDTRYFGSYQAIRVPEEVQAKIEDKVTEKPIVVAQPAAPNLLDILAPGQRGVEIPELKAGTTYYWRVEYVGPEGTVLGRSVIGEFKTR